MKIYKTQKEIEKDIKNGVLIIEGDVKFECSFYVEASIVVNSGDINARNIDARDINAGNIDARNINAWNIDAGNINARNINAGNIDAGDISAGDINAWNINARNIDARDILYWAFCCVYKSIKCFSIKAKREIHKEPICLGGKIEIKEKETSEELEIDGKKYSKQTIKRALQEYIK